MNDQTWRGDGTDNLFTLPRGEIYEYAVNANAHPLHVHVNPMQVVKDNDEWNQPGDWLDVIFSSGAYRQHLSDHAGTVIVHCHWLSHEDLGCMSQFTISEASLVIGAGTKGIVVLVGIIVCGLCFLGCVFRALQRHCSYCRGSAARPDTTRRGVQ